MDSITRGHRAKELMDDPLIKEAFELIEQQIHIEWKNASNGSDREELWYTLRALERFKDYFNIAMQNGDLDTKLGRENA